jgi:predicted aspartyl protease
MRTPALNGTRSRLWRALAPVTLLFAAVLAACSLGDNAVSAPPNCDNGTTVPMAVETDSAGGKVLLVELTVHGKGPYTFVVDTGSSRSLISRSVADDLGLQATGTDVPVAGLGGSQSVTPVRVAPWAMSSVRLPSLSIYAADLGGEGHDGLLGSDVLSRFGVVTIDFASHKLVVYQQIASSAGDTTHAVPASSHAPH